MNTLPTMTFAGSEDGLIWLDHTQTINGRVWMCGTGRLPADVMIIGDKPSLDEVTVGTAFTGPTGQVLRKNAERVGFPLDTCYLTNVFKFLPKGKEPSTEEWKLCMPILQEEIRRVQPKLIVCMGKNALRAIMGTGYAITAYHGTTLNHPELPGVKVFAMYHPSYLLHNPAAEHEYNSAWDTLAKVLNCKPLIEDKTDYAVLHTAEEVQKFVTWCFANYPDPLWVLDCEWDGQHEMDPVGYLRTIQLGYDTGYAVVIELRDVNSMPCVSYENEMAIFQVLAEAVKHDPLKLVGHQIRADGKWLLSRGVDIRPRTYYDTMVAEHTFNSVGPFGLEALTIKYTKMGRYDFELMHWVNEHQDLCQHGYGAVPTEILLPYAAKDVDAPRRIMAAQQPLLERYRQPRGDGIPSLLDIDMHTSTAIYELELNGLLVDQERLTQITKMYRSRQSDLEGKLAAMAAQLGMENYNFRSFPQNQKLLFEVLRMTPISTTGHKSWEWVVDQAGEATDGITPSTDKDTLAILADEPGAHPIVALLRDIRKVEYVCNQWLVPREDAANYDTTMRGGGLFAKIWPDGRLHARFSQLKETARFGSAQPNVQNWLKRAEGELKRIIGKEAIEQYFGAGAKFPSLRSVIIPAPGYVFMEADWKQAELFVLAGLSGDKTMWDALTTPGKDLHDLTAITAFSLRVTDAEGVDVPESYLINLARSQPKGAESAVFKDFQKTLVYRHPRGKVWTRKEFKDGIRVSAKNLNFGIPYGRGAQSIAIQVKAETGTETPLSELESEIQQMMDVWKTATYPVAWRYMEWCGQQVIEPGYLENPWGRRRCFPHPAPDDKKLTSKWGREAQNYPIQSTVADTCLIMLWQLARYKEQHNLHFRLVNQIHDAVLLEVPESEIEATREMLYATMGNISIPMPNGPPLRLDVDIDVMRRWGEKEE